MCSLKIFTHSVLLVTIPSILLYPQDHFSQLTLCPKKLDIQADEEKQPEDNYLLSYDKILNLLDELESGELEQRCGPDDLEKINHFLALLAKEGMLSDDSEDAYALACDVEDLLTGEDGFYEYAFSTGNDDEYVLIPAVCNDQGEVVLCKNWAKKQWKKTKKFAKTKKKELIIGAVMW